MNNSPAEDYTNDLQPYVGRIRMPFEIYPLYYICLIHIASWTGLVINIFGLYVIVCKSPIHFKGYRWHLTVYQIWSTTLDIVSGAGTAPVIFPPRIVAHPTGFLQKMGISPLAIAITILLLTYAMMTSVLQVLFYRWQAILPASNCFKLKSIPRRTSVIGFYFMALIGHALIPAALREHNGAFPRLVQSFPPYSVLSNISSDELLIVEFQGNKNFTRYVALHCLSAFAFCSMVGILLLHTMHILKQKCQQSNNEKQSFAYQKYVVILSTQMLVPMITIIEPLALLAIIVEEQIWNAQILVHLLWLCFANHGAVGTVTTLVLNEHYRLYLKGLFLSRGSDNSGSRPISISAVAYTTTSCDSRPCSSAFRPSTANHSEPRVQIF